MDFTFFPIVGAPLHLYIGTNQPLLSFFVVVVRFYLLIFRHKGRERKRGRETSMCERNINWLPLSCPQPGTWPDQESNGKPFSSQASQGPAIRFGFFFFLHERITFCGFGLYKPCLSVSSPECCLGCITQEFQTGELYWCS